jgi:hypothetical protein
MGCPVSGGGSTLSTGDAARPTSRWRSALLRYDFDFGAISTISAPSSRV